MLANYNKLWKLLIDRGMTKTQMRLASGISTVTLAKMNKGGKVRDEIIKKICVAMHCKPSDVVEYGRGNSPRARITTSWRRS